MGNAFCRACCPCLERKEIMKKTVRDLERFLKVERLDDLIAYIDKLLNNIPRGRHERIEKPSAVDSFINSGHDLTESFSKRLSRFCKKCFSYALNRRTIKVVLELLSLISELLPIQNVLKVVVGMALSLIGYLSELLFDLKEEVSSNTKDVIDLLTSMYDLAKHIKNSQTLLSRPKLEGILHCIVEATIVCDVQMKCSSVCRLCFATRDAADLKSLKLQLDDCSRNLASEADTVLRNTQPNLRGPSKVMCKTLEPRWNQDSCSHCVLRVKEHKIVPPTFNIGDCNVKNEWLLPNQVVDKWIPVQLQGAQGVLCMAKLVS